MNKVKDLISFPKLTSVQIYLFQSYISLLVIFDIISRIMDFDIFYALKSVNQINYFFGNFESENLLINFHRIHHLAPEAFFGIQILLSVLTILKFFPRICLFLNFLILVSLHNYNPYVLYGGDVLLRTLLLLAVFLIPSDRTKFNFSGMSIWVVIACLYLMSFYYKIISPEWQNLSAINNALKVKHLTTSFGSQFINSHILIGVFTFLTLLFELLTPFLLILKRSTFTIVALGLILFFHTSLMFFLKVGMFSYICFSFIILLYPLNGKFNLKIPPLKYRQSRFNTMALSFISLLLIYVNLGQIWTQNVYNNDIISLTRLDHRWNMFHQPSLQMQNDNQYRVFMMPEAEQSGEQEIIKLKDHRWAKFFNNFNRIDAIASYYLDYSCKNNINFKNQEIIFEINTRKNLQYIYNKICAL